jgi:hypothetical protein
MGHSEPVTAARLLMAIGDDATAETALVAEASRIRGQDHLWLVPLARALEEHGRLLGATVVYRALLNSVLDRAHARAYHHAARYWARLQAIAAQRQPLGLLQPHAEFEAEVCGKHSRPSGLTSTGCALCPRTMRTRICITARRGSSAYREQHARHPGSLPCP